MFWYGLLLSCPTCAGIFERIEVFCFTGPYTGYWMTVGWECGCSYNYTLQGIVHMGRQPRKAIA